MASKVDLQRALTNKKWPIYKWLKESWAIWKVVDGKSVAVNSLITWVKQSFEKFCENDNSQIITFQIFDFKEELEKARNLWADKEDLKEYEKKFNIIEKIKDRITLLKITRSEEINIIEELKEARKLWIDEKVLAEFEEEVKRIYKEIEEFERECLETTNDINTRINTRINMILEENNIKKL